jgi:hypothetical protein
LFANLKTGSLSFSFVQRFTYLIIFLTAARAHGLLWLAHKKFGNLNAKDSPADDTDKVNAPLYYNY